MIIVEMLSNYGNMTTYIHTRTLCEKTTERGEEVGKKYVEKKNTSNASKYRFKTIVDNDERTSICVYEGKKERKKEKKFDGEQVKYFAYVRRLTGLLMFDHRRLVFFFFSSFNREKEKKRRREREADRSHENERSVS